MSSYVAAEVSGSAAAQVLPTQGADSFAGKLNRLFAAVPKPGQGEYSPEDVSRAVAERGGNISPAYIYLLRKGQRDNPTKKHIEALADFFGVPAAYFFAKDEASGQWDEHLALAGAVKDAGIRLIAERAAGLSPAALDAVLRIVEVAREIEHVPGSPGVLASRAQ